MKYNTQVDTLYKIHNYITQYVEELDQVLPYTIAEITQGISSRKHNKSPIKTSCYLNSHEHMSVKGDLFDTLYNVVTFN